MITWEPGMASPPSKNGVTLYKTTAATLEPLPFGWVQDTSVCLSLRWKPIISVVLPSGRQKWRVANEGLMLKIKSRCPSSVAWHQSNMVPREVYSTVIRSVSVGVALVGARFLDQVSSFRKPSVHILSDHAARYPPAPTMFSFVYSAALCTV